MTDKEKAELELAIADQDESKADQPVTKDDAQGPEPAAQDGAGDGDAAPADDADGSMAHDEADESATSQPPASNVFSRLKNWTTSHKKISIPLGILLFTAAVGGVVAATDARFTVMNIFSKAAVTVVILDQKTGQPIPKVNISLAGKTAMSDAKGKLTLSDIPYGRATLVAKKSAYADLSQGVVVSDGSTNLEARLRPVGIRVTLVVKNTLSGKTLGGVKATVGASDALSDESGMITLIVPPQDAKSIDVTFTLDGYNQKKIAVDTRATSTDIAMTPAGKVYFLSNRTGTINVMKDNLDGTNPEVILQGTGNENKMSTQMTESKDRKYLALVARREGDKDKTYVLDTSDNSLEMVDDGAVSYTLLGWTGHTLVFRVERDLQPFLPKKTALKLYDADAKKISVLDESDAEGNQFYYKETYFSSPYFLNDGFIYVKAWSSFPSKESYLIHVSRDGKKTVEKSFDTVEFPYIQIVADTPSTAYIKLSSGSAEVKSQVMQYTAQATNAASLSVERLNEMEAVNSTKLTSQDASKTAWSEYRDGKSTVLIGDANGKNGKPIISQDEYYVYGWHGNGIVLLTKKGTELYAMPIDAPDGTKPIKTTDFLPSSQGFGGY